MTQIIPVTNHVLKVFRNVTERITALQNTVYDKDQSISLSVEWGSRPSSIYIHLYLWDETGNITYSESAHWDYDVRANGEGLLYNTIKKWEEAYGF